MKRPSLDQDLDGTPWRKLADHGDVRLAFCWPLVRRGFYELAPPGRQ